MKRFFHYLVVFLIVALGVTSISNYALAFVPRASLSWSQPTNLSVSETQSETPSITADAFGGVHVVWSEFFDDGRSFIMYTALTNGTWSEPQEIITSPSTETTDSPSVVADLHGDLHLMWKGGATIYYSRANAHMAGSAQNWLAPQALEFLQANVDPPFLMIDQNDHLHAIYAITIGENSGIYYLRSIDRGQNWSDPITIYKNSRSDRMVNFPRLAVGADGMLHAVWVESEYPITFPPIGIRYSVSQANDGGSWSEAVSIADGPYSYPAIQTRNREVHITWSGTLPDRYRFHRWSPDNGQTWYELWRNVELGGYQGYSSLVRDSGQGLNWLTAAGIYTDKSEAVVYSRWSEDYWSPIENALERTTGLIGQNINNVAATVALGNELHVVCSFPLVSSQRPEGWQNDIYYLRADLNTPTVAAVALPTPTASVPTPTATARVAAPTVRPTLNAWLAAPPSSGGGSMLSVIFISMLSALVLSSLVILIIRRRQ